MGKLKNIKIQIFACELSALADVCGYVESPAAVGQYIHPILNPTLLWLSFPEHSTLPTMQSQPRQKKTIVGAAPGTTQEVWSWRRELVS